MFSAKLLVVSAKENFGIPLDYKVVVFRGGHHVDDVGHDLMVNSLIELLEVQLFGEGEELNYLADKKLCVD